MGLVNLPNTLGPAIWEKQRAALAKVPKVPATKLGEELKLLAKLHLGIDWDAFGSDKLDSSEEAQARLAELDSARGGKVKALVEQAQAVETSASKFETEAKKDKQFPKEPMTAVGAVVKAAKTYRADIDAFVSSARKALETRLAALNAQEKKAPKVDAGKPGAESKAAVRIRAQGLAAIRKIMKPVPGGAPLRFVIVQGKVTVATYMGPSVGPAQEEMLKSLIPNEAPYKTFKDPQGELIWENKAVTFVTDRLPGGLAKKMQLWLKKILKLNLKLRVRKTTGEAEETDGDDVADDMLELEPGDAASLEATDEKAEQAENAGADASTGFNARLAALMPKIKQALSAAHPRAADIKLKANEAGTLAGRKEFAQAHELLDALEEQLAAGAPAASVSAAAAQSVRDAVQGLQEAREAVDDQISRLQTALKASGDRDLVEISEFGLNGVMGNFKVRLMASLPELRSAQGDGLRVAAAKALPIANGLGQHLKAEPRVEACDDNPFGVPVSIRSTLGAALNRLTAALEGVATA